jgi:SAM-dependent methyltransferase
LEELERRIHELPPRGQPLRVTDCDPDRTLQAAEFLRNRGHIVHAVALDPAAMTEAGPSATWLWQPSPFLIEALEFMRTRGTFPPGENNLALDVAAGSGRDAVYLAMNGFAVEAVDRLPDALERAADLAARSGVRIATTCRDLEREPALGEARYALVTVVRYLQRTLFPALRAAIAPSGHIVYETFHERNRETGKRPARHEHLLHTGELAKVFDGFELLIARDAVERDGRFFSQLLARKPTHRPMLGGGGPPPSIGGPA